MLFMLFLGLLDESTECDVSGTFFEQIENNEEIKKDEYFIEL